MNSFSKSKQSRKEAEQNILANMREINNRRKETQAKQSSEPVDKEQVKSVLENFLHIKKTSSFNE